jgi:hypothetical protein
MTQHSTQRSKRSSNKAAGEESTAGVPSGYIEDAFETRTKLEAFFSVRGLFVELLNDVADLRQNERLHGETDGAFGAWCGEDDAPAEDSRSRSCHDGR